MDLTTLLLFGVPLPVLVFGSVQLFKMVKLVKTSDQARLATIGISMLLGAAVVGASFLPADTVKMVTFLVTTFYGAIVSALGYNQTLGKSPTS